MTMNLSSAEIAGSVQGTVLARGRPATGVSTDTRTLRPGDIFFALPGEGSKSKPGANGHRFVLDAAGRGAAGAVVSAAMEDLPPGFALVRVDDTLLALGRLASYWRQRMPARLAAVTGSVGKTSTKGMLGLALSAYRETLVAPASYNNEIGLPLTLLQLDRPHVFGVVELAMRAPGEIAYLARIARPEVGVITNIGASHVGRLGTREATARAKGELLPLLPPTGAAVLKRSGFFFGILSELSAAPVVSFDREGPADVQAEDVVDLGLSGTRFALVLPEGRVTVTLSVPGAHQVENALAAAAAAWALGVPAEAIARGLAEFTGAEMRGRVLQAGGVTVIDDSYNAAPDSVQAALRLLASVPGRRLVVFADMLELGDEALDAHRVVGEQVAEAGVAQLLAVGDHARAAAEAAAERGVGTAVFGTPEEALGALKAQLQPGDTVLVKGSRMMRLERVVEGLLSNA
jgi:UDP-N-acetylmuramoyl-tripeptide--D-alanyl-D-alanine ligase